MTSPAALQQFHLENLAILKVFAFFDPNKYMEKFHLKSSLEKQRPAQFQAEISQRLARQHLLFHLLHLLLHHHYLQLHVLHFLLHLLHVDLLQFHIISAYIRNNALLLCCNHVTLRTPSHH